MKIIRIHSNYPFPNYYWLKVPFNFLKEYGLIDKLNSSSKIRNNCVYIPSFSNHSISLLEEILKVLDVKYIDQNENENDLISKYANYDSRIVKISSM